MVGMNRMTDVTGLKTQEERKMLIVVREEREVRQFSGESPDYTVKEFAEEIGLVLRKEQDEEERLWIVVSHLTGAAQEEVRYCGRSVTSAEDALDILETAFGDRRSLSEVLLAFAGRQQTKDEDLRSYANDLVQCFQALQAKETKMGCRASDEKLLNIHFVEGLKDKGLVWDLKRQMKTQDLAFHEIREWALEWEEHFRKQVSNKVQVDAVSGVDQVIRSGSQKKEQAKQQQLLEMKLENEKLRRELEAEKGKGIEYRQRVCFRCRSPGHLVKECKKRKRAGKRVCFRCQEQGHLIKECREIKVAKGKQSSRDGLKEKDSAFQEKEREVQQHGQVEELVGVGRPQGSQGQAESSVSKQQVSGNGLGPFLRHMSLEKMRRAQQEDQAVGPILSAWPAKPVSAPTSWQGEVLEKKHDRLCRKNGLLHRQMTDPKEGSSEQLVIPSSFQSEVLRSCHKVLGHKKFQSIAEQLRPHVYWPGMYKDLENYLAECEVCMGA